MQILHKIKFVVLVLALLLPRLYGHEIGVAFKPEFNRTFYYCHDFEVLGTLQFGNASLKSGVALGMLGGGQREMVSEIKMFLAGGYTLPIFQPLHFGLTYIYDGLPDYEAHSHSLLPFIGLNWKRAGFTVGFTNRWTSFFNEPAIYESINSLSGYVNFYTTEKFRIGLRLANFSDFAAANMGAYSLNLNSDLQISKRFLLINELELYQSGSIGLTATFYGIAYKGGIVYKW
jgi:hypothetical protein